MSERWHRTTGRRRPAVGRRAAAAVLSTCVVLAAACSGGDDAAESDPAETEIVERTEWGEVFAEEGATGTFALRDVGADTTHVWNGARAVERRLPASTFKIANSMVILETGVVDDVDTVVAWDGVERELDVWNRDHSLRSGIEVSAVWMYQLLAREVGAERMAAFVQAVDYGNGLTGPAVDEFWLRGDVRINPLEQLDFLERMVVGDLPVRPEVIDAVEEIIVRERGDGWTWSHKTGTALAEDPVLGWLVGVTRHGDRVRVFAMNVDLIELAGLGGQLDPQVRQRIARRILELEGALPAA